MAQFWVRLVVAVVVGMSSLAVKAAPPSVDDFFKAPTFARAALSPSGRFLAVGVGTASGRIGLGVIDLEQRNEPAKLVGGFDDADIGYFQWLNDQRLVFTVTENDAPVAQWRGAQGLWAVDRDGSDERKLIERQTFFLSNKASAVADRVLTSNHTIDLVPADDSDDVIVTEWRWDGAYQWTGSVAHRLDTRTGLKRSLGPIPDSRVQDWVFDGRGEMRAALARSDGRARLYWRGKAGEWTLLEDFESQVTQRMTPQRVDGDQLYVTTGSGEAGARALYRYDIAARKILPEPVFSIAGFDYNGQYQVDHGTGRVIAMHYEADAAGTHWFDPQLKTAQQEIDKLLPATANRIVCTRCTDAARLVVRAVSDRQPALYFLFDTKTRQLEYIGGARPWIDPKQMATQDFVRIKARDGLPLPIYITKPRGGDPKQLRPAVVLVHGGPQVRGSVWGWDADAQFLASRGYVVIEPEFRGGSGFGTKHLEAGFKQWGLAMQDDVTDATLWAIREAGVDPKRICIAGASYGGYAALMGLVREPELYRCGISWVGVTEPEYLFSLPYSDLPEDWKRYGLRTMLGDPKADKERFTATSPLQQADKIRQPLLLAYGGADRRVPLKHGTDFRNAVTRNNRNVEWVVYKDEGHGWGAMDTRRDFWTRVEKFLARNIGDGAPAVATK